MKNVNLILFGKEGVISTSNLFLGINWVLFAGAWIFVVVVNLI